MTVAFRAKWLLSTTLAIALMAAFEADGDVLPLWHVALLAVGVALLVNVVLYDWTDRENGRE